MALSRPRLQPVAFALLGILFGARTHALDVPAAEYQQLLRRVGNQEAAIESFRRTLQDLRSEVARIRSTTEQLKLLANTPRSFATQEQYQRLAEQVRSVERNRVADRSQILGAIENLRSLAKTPASPHGQPAPAKGKTKPKPASPARRKPAP